MKKRPAIHPGEILADELEELGVTPTALSRQIGVPPNRVTQIIQGKRAITGDTALRLGRLFGTGAEFWLNLQSLYELRRAEQKAGKTIRALPTLQRRKGGQGRQPAHGVATALTQRGRRRAIEV